MLSLVKAGLKLTALTLVICAGSTAYAQGGGGGGGGGGAGGGGRGGGGGFGMMMGGGMGGRGMQEMGVNSQDLDGFGKILNLSPDQAKAAKELLDGHLADYQAQADVARKAMEDLREEARENGDFEVFRTKGPAIWSKLTDSRKKIETAFMSDFKSILTPDQLKAWPKVEMAHRREAARGGFAGPGVSGERVDLVRLVDKIELPADAKSQVNSVLDAYEVEYDRELSKRTELTEKVMAAFQKAMQGGGQGDFGAMFQDPELQKLFTEGREQAIKVREVNRKYARQIQGVLPADKGEAFDAEFRKESFPQIYRTRYAAQALAAAAKFEDLDASQRESLKALTETYSRESNTINKSSEEATEKQERELNPGNMMQRFGPGGGGGADDPMRALRDQRRDLESKTVESLKAMLTEAQRAKLPPQREDNGPGGGQGRRMGNNNADPNGGNNNNGGGNNNNRRNRPNRNPGNQQPAPGNN